MKRAAIYARYSSEMQNARSIEDQLAICRDFALARGLTVTATFADRAISGASLVTRPELLALLAAAARGEIDVIVSEALDRLSRDQEDIAHIFKRLRYRGVTLLTIAEGEVCSMHIGLKGTMNAMFLEELGRKVRRGQQGRVRDGRSAGGLCFGYDVVRDASDEKGRRTINEQEAAIVRRIFADYAAGQTPLAIATALNREGVPPPRGLAWNASTLNGSRARGNGILNNMLYAGRMTWNRQSFVKDPETGKRQARANPESDWLAADMPELRIVDQDLWQKVQGLRAARGGMHAWHGRKPKRVLSGLLVCRTCGGSYIIHHGDYLGCSTRFNKGLCDNARIVTMREVESRVLAGVKQKLLAPDVVRAAVESYRIETARLKAGEGKRRADLERAGAELKRKLSRLVTLLEEGAEAAPLLGRLAELEKARAANAATLAALGAAHVVDLHPKAAERYAALVTELEARLAKGEAAGAESLALIRSLITRIVVIPTKSKAPVGLDIEGDLAALLHDQNGPGTQLGSLMVAGRRCGQSPTLPMIFAA